MAARRPINQMIQRFRRRDILQQVLEQLLRERLALCLELRWQVLAWSRSLAALFHRVSNQGALLVLPCRCIFTLACQLRCLQSFVTTTVLICILLDIIEVRGGIQRNDSSRWLQAVMLFFFGLL